jgi:hypothetical protein
VEQEVTVKRGLIGALLLTALLSVGVCLPVSAQVAGSSAPAGAAIPWNSLSQDQQHLLSRMSGQWEQLPPQRQQALASGSQRWLGMSKDQRTQARQRFNQWQQMPPQRRDQLRQRWEDFRAQPQERQQADRDNFRKFQQLPQQRRQQLRQRWKSATPSQRQEMIARARERRAPPKPR